MQNWKTKDIILKYVLIETNSTALIINLSKAPTVNHNKVKIYMLTSQNVNED